MSLHNELHDLFGRIQDAPWPGEDQAMDRFARPSAQRRHRCRSPTKGSSSPSRRAGGSIGG